MQWLYCIRSAHQVYLLVHHLEHLEEGHVDSHPASELCPMSSVSAGGFGGQVAAERAALETRSSAVSSVTTTMAAQPVEEATHRHERYPKLSPRFAGVPRDAGGRANGSTVKSSLGVAPDAQHDPQTNHYHNSDNGIGLSQQAVAGLLEYRLSAHNQSDYTGLKQAHYDPSVPQNGQSFQRQQEPHSESSAHGATSVGNSDPFYRRSQAGGVHPAQHQVHNDQKELVTHEPSRYSQHNGVSGSYQLDAMNAHGVAVKSHAVGQSAPLDSVLQADEVLRLSELVAEESRRAGQWSHALGHLEQHTESAPHHHGIAGSSEHTWERLHAEQSQAQREQLGQESQQAAQPVHGEALHEQPMLPRHQRTEYGQLPHKSSDYHMQPSLVHHLHQMHPQQPISEAQSSHGAHLHYPHPVHSPFHPSHLQYASHVLQTQLQQSLFQSNGQPPQHHQVQPHHAGTATARPSCPDEILQTTARPSRDEILESSLQGPTASYAPASNPPLGSFGATGKRFSPTESGATFNQPAQAAHLSSYSTQSHSSEGDTFSSGSASAYSSGPGGTLLPLGTTLGNAVCGARSNSPPTRSAGERLNFLSGPIAFRSSLPFPTAGVK